VEQALVETEEFPMIVFEVIGISCGGLHFDFEKEFYLIRRLLQTLVEVGNDDVTYIDDIHQADHFKKELTYETRCLKRLCM
jgi:hypothetical protein